MLPDTRVPARACAAARVHIDTLPARILEVVRKMFNLAEAWGSREDGSNPCCHVQKYKEKKRERFLTEAEFHRLG